MTFLHGTSKNGILGWWQFCINHNDFQLPRSGDLLIFISQNIRVDSREKSIWKSTFFTHIVGSCLTFLRTLMRQMIADPLTWSYFEINMVPSDMILFRDQRVYFKVEIRIEYSSTKSVIGDHDMTLHVTLLINDNYDVCNNTTFGSSWGEYINFLLNCTKHYILFSDYSFGYAHVTIFRFSIRLEASIFSLKLLKNFYDQDP